MATIRLAEYQQKLAQTYNRDVKRKEFCAGELVLRRAIGNTGDVNAGKLAPTWEGSYRVIAIAGMGAYYLEDLDERPLHWPQNVHNLKKFYHWPLVHMSMSWVWCHMYTILSNMRAISVLTSLFILLAPSLLTFIPRSTNANEIKYHTMLRTETRSRFDPNH